MNVASLIIMLVVTLAGALVWRIDDPVGRELDAMRSRTELRALLTPLFAGRD
jgi:hypothetical protein